MSTLLTDRRLQTISKGVNTVNSFRFSTLVTAISKAGLMETLRGIKVATIFAPTDDAFSRVAKEDLTRLMSDKSALVTLLMRHGLEGSLFTEAFIWQEHTTIGGDKIATQVFREGLRVVSFVNGKRTEAFLVEKDILATNGVIHAIDNVLCSLAP